LKRAQDGRVSDQFGTGEREPCVPRSFILFVQRRRKRATTSGVVDADAERLRNSAK